MGLSSGEKSTSLRNSERVSKSTPRSEKARPKSSKSGSVLLAASTTQHDLFKGTSQLHTHHEHSMQLWFSLT